MNYMKAKTLSIILILAGILCSLFLFAFEEINTLFIIIITDFHAE